MLNLFIRCIVVYFFLLVAMRLMGKRQLGQLQPFEFAITLVASELACIPMDDASIPILYGILPVFTMFVIHIIMTKLAGKSVRFRKVLNGKPVVLIEKGNILPKMLLELNMSIDDLMESLRTTGYFNPTDVDYAILETNGNLTVLPKAQERPLAAKDLNLTVEESVLPITVIMEGNFLGCNMKQIKGISKERILTMLTRLGFKKEDVLLLLLADTKVFLQPYKGQHLIAQLGDDNTEEISVEEETS